MPGARSRQRIRRALVVGALVAQERDQVARRRKADAEHLGLGGLVPELVDRQRREPRPLRQQPDRARVGELPLACGDQDPRIGLARPHSQACLALVGGNRRIAEPHRLHVGRPALADLDLLADAADHWAAVLHGEREARTHGGVRFRHARIPSRPDHRVSPLEQEAVAGMRTTRRIVQRRRPAGRKIMQPLPELLVAAVEDLVEQQAVGLGRIGRPQDEDVDFVFDHSARIARRLVEVDDHLVLGRSGIELAFGHALDAHVAAHVAEGMALGERLDRVDLDLGDAGLRGAGEYERAECDGGGKRFAGHGVLPRRFLFAGCRYSASAPTAAVNGGNAERSTKCLRRGGLDRHALVLEQALRARRPGTSRGRCRSRRRTRP